MAGENACLFQVLAEHQKSVLEQLLSSQAQANAKLLESVTHSLEKWAPPGGGTSDSTGASGQTTTPMMRVQKMTTEDDPKVFLNTFERTAMAAGWAHAQ